MFLVVCGDVYAAYESIVDIGDVLFDFSGDMARAESSQAVSDDAQAESTEGGNYDQAQSNPTKRRAKSVSSKSAITAIRSNPNKSEQTIAMPVAIQLARNLRRVRSINCRIGFRSCVGRSLMIGNGCEFFAPLSSSRLLMNRSAVETAARLGRYGDVLRWNRDH